MQKVITFDEDLKLEVLRSFNKDVDIDGYIIEKDNPSQKILTPQGEPLELRDFAGIRKGSLIFIKSDINSLIELADELVG
ncbi:MAG: hypothetical protein KAR05_10260 [Candidatus Omnitrophica bacterium]|nr:hypothetical protein [Candidatus Omnitrophota bacterium]